jgi:GntR family transcriptional regulator
VRGYGDLVKINRDSPEWPRQQAASLIREEIRAGRLGPRLPSQMELADQLGLSERTVERALAILKDEGLIYAVTGRGTFVRQQ